MNNSIKKSLDYNGKWWYSVIIALLTVGFMLMISTTVYRLVLNEIYDTNWLTNYYKAYNWAEWAMELWLLDYKKNTYWYENSIIHSINSWSVLLSDNPTDYTQFKIKKDVFISYDLEAKSNIISNNILPGKYFIIPLFYTDNSWVIHKIENNLNLTVLWSNQSFLWWNIIWENAWISWKSNFDETSLWNKKTISWLGKFNFINETISNFLSTSNNNYLVLFNSDPNNNISFNLTTIWPNNYFSLDKVKIISSWEIGDYKQNLRLEIDNWRYLNLLRYSIFSN